MQDDLVIVLPQTCADLYNNAFGGIEVQRGHSNPATYLAWRETGQHAGRHWDYGGLREKIFLFPFGTGGKLPVFNGPLGT
jgi:hypothetical protein